MVRKIRRAVCILLAVMLLGPSALAASYSGYINASTTIYSKPYYSGRTASVSKNTKVEITGVKDGWARVERAGITGYCPVKYVTLTDRLKGYVKKDTKVYQYAYTSSRTANVSVNTVVYVIGQEGNFYRVQNADGSVTGYLPMNMISKNKIDVVQEMKDKVVLMDWFEGGSSVLPRGSYGTIYDINTGISIRVKRMGGTNHADLEPATAEDAAKLLKISGGEYSWNSHAVILIANGKYVASAINCMPHGEQTLYNNNFDGQFCLHMVHSRTHGTDCENVNHQAAIERAWYWANH